MVDIHSHILPGVDDGPETLEESVAMVRIAAENGTTDIVATPHSNMQFTFRPELIEEKITELSKASGDVLRIHRGCDFHLHYDNIQDSLEHPHKYAINNKRYVLVEFSELLIAQTTDDVFYRMEAAGMTPIITHPERNVLLHKRMEKIKTWVESGALVQVTAQSFLGRFGRSAKSFADELMKRGLVHFIASDAHDTKHRPPILTEAYEYIAKAYGQNRAEALFILNPRAALTGDYLEFEEPQAASESKKWYRFWA